MPKLPLSPRQERSEIRRPPCGAELTRHVVAESVERHEQDVVGSDDLVHVEHGARPYHQASEARRVARAAGGAVLMFSRGRNRDPPGTEKARPSSATSTSPIGGRNATRC